MGSVQEPVPTFKGGSEGQGSGLQVQTKLYEENPQREAQPYM